MFLRPFLIFLTTEFLLLGSALLFFMTDWTFGHKIVVAQQIDGNRQRISQAVNATIPDVYNNEALKTYQEMLKLARELNNRPLEGMALVAIGSIYLYHEQGEQPSLAIQHLEPGLEIAREVNDRLSEKRALLNLATAYINLGYYNKTIQYAEELLKLAQQENNLALQGDSLQALGAAEFYRKNYAQAIRHYEKCLQFARQINDAEREAVVLAALGEAHIAAGEPAKGEYYLQQSEAINQRLQQAGSNAQLAIQPTDSWNIVVAKAISLRRDVQSN